MYNIYERINKLFYGDILIIFIGYLDTQKKLGYECLIDTQCSHSLVLTTDSSIVFVKNVTLDGKRKFFLIILGIAILFSDVKSAKVMGTSLPYNHTVVTIPDQDANASRLIKPSTIKINSNIEPKIMMPSFSSIRITTKSELENSQWVKDFVSTVRGGENEKLIRSIISKVSESDWDIPSINKILKKITELTLEIGTNQKLWRILAELEKPMPQSSILVEGWLTPLQRHINRNNVKKNKYSTPSVEFLLDSTKCYGHREAYNTPRSYTERFESNTAAKLAKNALKDPILKKEYTKIKNSLNEGIHPINIGKKSAYVSAELVLIKAAKGRYLAKVSDTHVEIIGFVSRSSDNAMLNFANLMNKMYNLDLKGYY